MGFKPDAPLEVIDPKEAALRAATGALANGHTAPPAAVIDTQPAKGGFTPDAPAASAASAASAAPPERPASDTDTQHPLSDAVKFFTESFKKAPASVMNMISQAGDMVQDPYGTMGRTLMGAIKTAHTALANPEATASAVGTHLANLTPEQGATEVGAPLVAGLGIGGLAKGVGAMAGASDAAAAHAASDAGKLGLQITQNNPVATVAAGNSAGPVLDVANNSRALEALGRDAGVNTDEQPVNHATLTSAADAPGQVLDQGAASLPTAPLSPAARNAVAAARGEGRITKGSPIVEQYINDAESRLLDPDAQFSGTQIRAERNGMNADANTNMLSQDADVRAKGKYQRAVVNALDQHVADTMPANSAISPDMIANARATLAKNYTLRDLIGKGGDVDLQGLAADYRDNPNKFTGAFRTVAQFAHEHPEVTGSISDATRISPPSFVHDITDVNLLHRPVGSLFQAATGWAGRRALTKPIGSPGSVPVAGLGGEFGETAGEAPGAAIPTEGISAEALRPEKLGDTLPGQRGGAPTDIGGLRQLMNNPRTYGGGAAVPKTAAELELEKALKKLQEQPTTYSGIPLGQSFGQ